MILACSPRAGGNCDKAAALYAQAFVPEGGEAALEQLSLRSYRLSPCVACDKCGALARALAAVPGKSPEGQLRDFVSGLYPSGEGQSRAIERPVDQRIGQAFGCPLGAKDDVPRLLDAILTARSLCLVAPVYFYHVPAQLKALLDRTQALWNAQSLGFFAGRPRKTCRVILIGARQQGEQLFTGSLLSLGYALGACGYDLAAPLLLKGLDGPDALAGSDEARAQLAQYAEEAAHAEARA